MIDMEKVIKGVECHRKKVQTTNSAFSCLECPYSEPKPTREWCMYGLMDDIYSMLKEQEAQKVTWRVGRAHCPSCGELFPKKQDKQYIRFCNYCGQAVKWE